MGFFTLLYVKLVSTYVCKKLLCLYRSTVNRILAIIFAEEKLHAMFPFADTLYLVIVVPVIFICILMILAVASCAYIYPTRHYIY